MYVTVQSCQSTMYVNLKSTQSLCLTNKINKTSKLSEVDSYITDLLGDWVDKEKITMEVRMIRTTRKKFLQIRSNWNSCHWLLLSLILLSSDLQSISAYSPYHVLTNKECCNQTVQRVLECLLSGKYVRVGFHLCSRVHPI